MNESRMEIEGIREGDRHSEGSAIAVRARKRKKVRDEVCEATVISSFRFGRLDEDQGTGDSFS